MQQQKKIESKNQDKDNNGKQNSQPQKKQPKIFKCEKGNHAEFCCAQPKCKFETLKCITSNTCESCKKNHAKCPREMRIAKILQVAEQKAKNCPAQKIPISFPDLLQKLITQLTNIRQKFLTQKLSYWGLSPQYTSLLFERNLSNKTSSLIASFLDEQPIYPDQRFYLPPQFQQDIITVEAINKQLDDRIVSQFSCYQGLAEIDCQLKVMERKGWDWGQMLAKGDKYMREALDTYAKLHEKFGLIVIKRLELSQNFAGYETQFEVKEIEDFHYIAKKLFQISIVVLRFLYRNKMYQDFLGYYRYAMSVYDKNRKQLALKGNYCSNQIIQFKFCEAYCFFYLQQYEDSFDFLHRQESRFNAEILDYLIKIYQKYKYDRNLYIKYLHLLESFRPDDRQILQKILSFYIEQNNQQKIIEYMIKLSNLRKKQLASLNDQQLCQFFKNQEYLINYHFSKKEFMKYGQMAMEILNLFRSFRNRSQYLFEIELRIRKRLIQWYRYDRNPYYNFALHCFEICQEYVDIREKDKKASQVFLAKVKDYQVVFLNKSVSNKLDQQQNYKRISKCTSICIMINKKFFQPFYQMAKLSFQLKKQDALVWQNRANEIYPTSICYTNKAFILYQLAMKEENTHLPTLKRSLLAINKSLNLRRKGSPQIYDKLTKQEANLYFLRGIINQNLGQYRRSNEDFNTVIKVFSQLKQSTYDVQKKIAQNNELIIKSQSATLPPQQKKSLLSQSALLYNNCLCSNNSDIKCLLGYARVLKLQQKYPQSQKYFNKILQLEPNSQYRQQIYMYLGNIKEEQGKIYDGRDYEKLEEALKLYLQAGKIKDNKDNLIRIYRELDYEKELKEVERDNGFK